MYAGIKSSIEVMALLICVYVNGNNYDLIFVFFSLTACRRPS